jgi:hypothetical protein
VSGTLDGSDESKLIAEPRADLDGLAYGVLLESRGRSAPRRADPTLDSSFWLFNEPPGSTYDLLHRWIAARAPGRVRTE